MAAWKARPKPPLGRTRLAWPTRPPGQDRSGMRSKGRQGDVYYQDWRWYERHVQSNECESEQRTRRVLGETVVGIIVQALDRLESALTRACACLP